MRLAMAQMHMEEDVDKNLETTLAMMRKAKEAQADLILFPEIQLSPFFPKNPGRDVTRWTLTADAPAVMAIRDACRALSLWASPNLYLEKNGKRYDTSLMIDDHGEVIGVSKMVHIYQAENFYECDYYTPSEEGFRVFETPFGRIGIVICFDRHIPGSIRSCARQGADLVLIPTANLVSEPMELFEWEIRVQAYQNTVFAAMCNRVGTEDQLTFAGQSLVAGPDGSLLNRAGAEEGLFCTDLSFPEIGKERKKRNWLSFDSVEDRCEDK